MLLQQRLRWAGHVARMADHRLPKQTLFGELSSGYRSRGAPKKRFKDVLKSSLSSCQIDHRTWTTEAMDRDEWRHIVKSAVSTFEATRRVQAEEKRTRRKHRQATSPEQTFSCSHCNRLCGSRIGLHSHMRACSKKKN